MKNCRKLILLILLFPNLVFTQTPDWVKNYGKSSRFPEFKYITGFGIAQLNEQQNQAKAIYIANNNARSNLVQKIRVRIITTLTTEIQETNSNLNEYFSKFTQTTSSLEIQGLDNLSYVDQKKKMCYGFAYVPRKKLSNIYRDKVTELRRKISDRLDTGRRLEKASKRIEAIKSYFSCYPLFAELEQAQAIIVVSQNSNSTDALNDNVSQDRIRISEVREAVARLIEQPVKSADDLAWYLTYCLKEQLNSEGVKVLVSPITYQDTGMGSQFSKYFKQIIENKIVEVAKWQVIPQTSFFQSKSNNVSPNTLNTLDVKYILTGTYWEQPDQIKFISNLRKLSDSRIVASAEALVKNSIIDKTKLSLKPENFEQAFVDRKLFNEDEIIGGGLTIEAWTNKGAEDLLYTEGEIMQVYVRVNIPCYIRFIYHLANGQRTILLDNHYIDKSKVNKVYQIPQEFECSPPFGVEVLQVFARTEKFDSVVTKNVNGYEIITQDLKGFLTKTRGFKKTKKNTLQAEGRIVITTLE